MDHPDQTKPENSSAAPRGRQPGFRMSEEHRTKIRNSKILMRLIACGEGELELSSVQANVGLGLLKKIMPDLSSTQHTGDEENPIAVTNRIENVIVDPKRPGSESVPAVPESGEV